MLSLTWREELAMPLVLSFPKDQSTCNALPYNFEDFSLFIFGQVFDHMSTEPCSAVLCHALANLTVLSH